MYHKGFVCVDTHDIPVVAVIKPDMMSSMPKGLTDSTGMDALTHAIKGYVIKGAWEMTDIPLYDENRVEDLKTQLSDRPYREIAERIMERFEAT